MTDKPVNVMFMVWSLGLGGAERVIIDLARGLDRKRFRPMVCCLDDRGPFAVELEADGVPVFSMHKRRGIDLLLIPRLVRLLRKENVDVINTHLWGANCWGRAAAWLRGIPVVVTEHSVDTWKGFGHRIADVILGNMTDRMVAVSDEVKTFYMKHARLSADRIDVVLNGIDTERFGMPGDAPHGLPLEPLQPYVLSVGRLSPEKGHEYLLSAFEEIGKKHPAVHLVFAGAGPEEESLRETAEKSLARDRIHFAGMVTDGLPALYAHAAVMVLPSLREGLPITALEALAAGTPVVATDVGANRQVLRSPAYGTVVPVGDVPALAGAAMEFLNTDDPQELQLKRKDYVRAEYSRQRMAERTGEILFKAIKDKK